MEDKQLDIRRKLFLPEMIRKLYCFDNEVKFELTIKCSCYIQFSSNLRLAALIELHTNKFLRTCLYVRSKKAKRNQIHFEPGQFNEYHF